MIVLWIIIPLLAAFLLPSLSRILPLCSRALAPIILMVGLAGTVLLWQQALPQSIQLAGFKPPWGINLYLDQLSLLMLSLIYGLSLLSFPWRERISVHALLLLLVAAGSALILSGDLFNIFVFYELASVASFGLIAAGQQRVAQLSALRYLLLSGAASVLFLIGIALIYWQTGTLNLAHLASLSGNELNHPVGWIAFSLIALGLGLKAELFPVNAWVPEVYASSPPWLSALLAGLVSKIAVLVLARILILVFDYSATQMVLLVLGLIGLVSAELAAWRSREYTRMLAFSSIGQLSLVAISLSIDGRMGFLAAITFVLHHLMVKPALFYLAWQGSLARLKGLRTVSPWSAALFTLFALSLIGVPPLPGFWAKLLLLIGLGGQEGGLVHLAIIAVLSMTVIEASYLFRLVVSFYQAPDAESAAPPHSAWNLIRSSFLALALLAAVILIQPLSEGLQSLTTQFGDVQHYILTVAGQ